MPTLFLEDLTPGQSFSGTTTIQITAEDIQRFAAEFDPQPFHLSNAGATDSVFGTPVSYTHLTLPTNREV